MSLQQTLKHVAFSALAATDRAFHPSSRPLSEIRQFLLLQYPSALGSAVHATPLISALHAAVPGAEITVCATGFALEIFRGNPGVHRLVETPNPTKHLLAAARAIRRVLPRAPFATLTSTANERSAIALASVFAGATSHVGFTLTPELYRVPLGYDPSLSQIANNFRIVAALGHAAPQASEPRVFFSPADLAHARGLLAGFAHPARPFAVFVTQTSPTQRKSWRMERFAAAARHLITRYDANIVLVGAAGERPGIDVLRQTIGDQALNLAGQTDLPQLAALLSLGRVALTLDTGTMHIGRAVSLPMVIIAPAWSPPVEWLPLNNPRFRILKNLDLPAAPPNYIIDEVSLDEVTDALDELWEADLPRP